MAFRPETAHPLMALAEVLLRGDNSLTSGRARAHRGLRVDTSTSACSAHHSHGAFAALQLDGGTPVVDAVMLDSTRRRRVAEAAGAARDRGTVQRAGATSAEADVAAARAEGATDVEIHDTVLIAAAFCMYNRYVDGLATWAPTEPAMYDLAAELIVAEGYQRER